MEGACGRPGGRRAFSSMFLLCISLFVKLMFFSRLRVFFYWPFLESLLVLPAIPSNLGDSNSFLILLVSGTLPCLVSHFSQYPLSSSLHLKLWEGVNSVSRWDPCWCTGTQACRYSNVSISTNTCLIEEKGIGLPQQEGGALKAGRLPERKKQGLEVNKLALWFRQVWSVQLTLRFEKLNEYFLEAWASSPVTCLKRGIHQSPSTRIP